MSSKQGESVIALLEPVDQQCAATGMGGVVIHCYMLLTALTALTDELLIMLPRNGSGIVNNSINGPFCYRLKNAICLRCFLTK